MEKIKKLNVSQTLGIGSTPLGNKVNELIDGYNEIVEWLEKTRASARGVQKYCEQLRKERENKEKNPKILRYELSHDKVGLIAHLAGGTSYHIHSDELTPEQLQIRDQLVEMEEK